MEKTLKISYITAIIAASCLMSFVNYGLASHGTISHQNATYDTNLEKIGFTLNVSSGHYKHSYGHRYGRHGRYRNHHRGYGYGYKRHYYRHRYGHRHTYPGKRYGHGYYYNYPKHKYGYRESNKYNHDGYQSGFSKGYRDGYKGYHKDPEYAYKNSRNSIAGDEEAYNTYLRGYENGYLEGYQKR